MRAKRKRNGSIIVRLLVIGLSVYMIVTLATLWNTYREKCSIYAGQLDAKEQKLAKIDELKYLLAEGSETALIEKAARERLGYEYSDATVYIDKSGS